MEPLPRYILFRKTKNIDPAAWHQQMYDRLWGAQVHPDAVKVVVFGRIDATRQWIVLYGTDHKQPQKVLGRYLGNHINSPSMVCVVWGRKDPIGQWAPEIRNVLCLFSSKWMVHDHYGCWAGLNRSDAQVPSGAQSAVTRNSLAEVPSLPPDLSIIHPAGAQDGPVPFTEYVTEGEDELKLYAETEKYYQECNDKRQEMIDTVNAESGETEFELGKSIRMGWIPEQRADKAFLRL